MNDNELNKTIDLCDASRSEALQEDKPLMGEPSILFDGKLGASTGFGTGDQSESFNPFS